MAAGAAAVTAVEEDREFARTYLAVAAPVVASAAVAPNPAAYAVMWGAVLAVIGVRREVRIRRRAARPMTPAVRANAQVIPLADSCDDSTDDSTRQEARAA